MLEGRKDANAELILPEFKMVWEDRYNPTDTRFPHTARLLRIQRESENLDLCLVALKESLLRTPQSDCGYHDDNDGFVIGYGWQGQVGISLCLYPFDLSNPFGFPQNSN